MIYSSLRENNDDSGKKSRIELKPNKQIEEANPFQISRPLLASFWFSDSHERT